MRKVILVGILVLVTAGLAMGQAWVPQGDVLGAHNNGGRGCAGCHQPHSGSRGSGQAGAADSGNYALWGQDASPLYGATIAFGDGGGYVEVLPANLTVASADVGGILLCLSCHDGNVTPSNMMNKQLYEQRVGLLTNPAYGSQPIPTLLGNDGSTAGNYFNDHPVGTNAIMVNKYSGAPMQGATSGVTVTASANGAVIGYNTGTPYDQFVKNYGWPAIAPGVWGSQYGTNGAGQPYVLCTTCHNQHVMNVYTSRVKSPIVSDGGGKYYATFFFVNGPYNPNITVTTNNTAPSTTQFCRQCHFGEANEANNQNTVTTQFQ
jgi:hypothetical protein